MTAQAAAGRVWRLLPWILIAILFRLHALGRLPGINGDEAWYGVQAQRWASGEAVNWRTPTGNLPGPLQLGALMLLQSLVPPSFALLRVPSLLASLGAMALAWAIGRRFLDRTTATVALLLMATLPANIAYARFGWDPSHLGLVTLAAAYAALAQRAILSALAFALAVAVHPTAVFTAPFLVLLALGRDMETATLRRALTRIAPYAAMLVAAMALLAVTTSGGQALASLGGAGERLVHPAQWAAFGLSLERLLTGETIYSYITGQGFGASGVFVDLAGALAIMGLAASGIVTLRGGRFGREAGIVTGWLASLLLFLLIAGAGALQPHVERYAVWLIAPTALALAILVRRLFAREAVASGVALLAAVLLLAGFWQHYFRVLETEGSRSARTFRSGPVEPKQAAVEQLAAITRAEGRIRVIAEDWWLYWPVAYLSRGEPIALFDAERGPAPTPAAGKGLFWLVHGGSALDRRIAALPGARLRSTIDATGEPQALHLWQTPAPQAKPIGAEPELG